MLKKCDATNNINKTMRPYYDSSTSAQLVYGLGLGLPCLTMFLHPVAARTDYRLFIALRVAVGIFEETF